MYDILIRNATLVDGTGAPGYVGDLAVEGGRIAALGSVSGPAEVELDGTGKVLSPGFIDSHGHSDRTIPVKPDDSYRLEQGVTTEFAGCCGGSQFPIAPDKLCYGKFETGREWFDFVHNQLKLGTNMMIQVGHGTIRSRVMGQENRRATPEEMEQMKALMREAMEAGAWGLSTGLAYAPGVFAPEEEIIELCKIVAEYNGYYTSHMRNQGNELLESVEETLRVTRATGVKTVISHLKSIGKPNWGKVAQVRARVDRAVYEEHLPVTWDAYPYLAGSTTLKVTLPPSVLAGGSAAMVERIRQPKWRAYVKDQILHPTEHWENAIGTNGFDSIMMIDVSRTKEAEGLTLQQYADRKGWDPFDAYFYLLEENMADGYVKTCNFVMCEEDMIEALKCPYALVGSDAASIPDTSKRLHPRGVGTFPRFLGRYVRDKGILPLETAISKLTGKAADFYNLKTKGYLKVGYDADLVLFDYDKILDHADFVNCFEPNEGIDTVIQGGKIVVEQGKFNGVCNGGALPLARD